MHKFTTKLKKNQSLRFKVDVASQIIISRIGGGNYEIVTIGLTERIMRDAMRKEKSSKKVKT
jgi:hypothetical protein